MMLRSPSEELAVLHTSSLAAVVEREVERLILNGRFSPGERINENKLALELGTSRGPVREAIRALEGSGLIVSVRNRGSFIRRLSVQEVREVYEIRSALFGLAGKLLAERVTADQIERLNGFVIGMEEASRERNFDAYYPLNLAFHEFIVDSAGNTMLAQQYEASSKSCICFEPAASSRVEVSASRTRSTVRCCPPSRPEIRSGLTRRIAGMSSRPGIVC